MKAIRVLYDPQRINYDKVIRYFFEIHNPTQTNGQGPDIGEQYESVIFYYDNQEKQIPETAINQLIAKGYPVATRLVPVNTF
nr:peptide-methionine (S)-S-oxide reductase [Candidatus Coxiella mudrowiae]